jgi:hypothetical protein
MCAVIPSALQLRRAGGVAAQGVTTSVADVVEHRKGQVCAPNLKDAQLRFLPVACQSFVLMFPNQCGQEAGDAARVVGDTALNLGNAAFNTYMVAGAGESPCS